VEVKSSVKSESEDDLIEHETSPLSVRIAPHEEQNRNESGLVTGGFLSEPKKAFV